MGGSQGIGGRVSGHRWAGLRALVDRIFDVYCVTCHSASGRVR